MSQEGFRVLIANRQSTLRVDESRVERVVRAIFADAAIHAGELSVAVVDDPTIHELNRRHLAHDYPTDVLSFPLDEGPGRLEGEVVVSADTAAACAAEFGWPAEDELLLYVVHGALHLVGHRDKGDDETRSMRAAEARYLRLVGVEPLVLDAQGASDP